MALYTASNKSQTLLGQIDEIDIDLLGKRKLPVNLDSCGYARKGSVRLHKLIAARVHGQLSLGMVVDHINGNKLDNRRENLRVCSQKENVRNTPKHRGNSKYKGVHWKSSRNKWYAQIKVDGRVKYLGVFNNEDDAAIVYNLEAKRLFGEFANINKIQSCEVGNVITSPTME